MSYCMGMMKDSAVEDIKSSIVAFPVVHMKPTGFEVISEQDCMELHYKYAAEKQE